MGQAVTFAGAALGDRALGGQACLVGEPPVDVTQTAHQDAGGSETETAWAARIVACPEVAFVGRVLPIGRELCFGRSEGGRTDVVIADRLLSRRHASLRMAASLVELVDHDSKNGSFLDGRRCRVGVVREDSVVRLGGTLVVLTPADPGTPLESELLGESAALRKLVAALDRVASQAVDVLLLGETGTGKELAARHLHRRSGRSGELVAVNCGAIPEKLIEAFLFGHKKGAFTGATSDQAGVFEQADGGTLFLDEVGELPLALQPRLLRVLENREYVPVGSVKPRRCDVRVVAATNLDLEAACERGDFRPDLYARLAGYVLRLPPLRERRGDIPELVRHFLRTLAPAREVEADASFLERLMLQDWPLNVRGLRALVQRVLVDTDSSVLRPEHLPDPVQGGRSTSQTGPSPPGVPPTAEELEHALRESGGSVAALATRFGKDRKQIYRWLKKYGLDPEEFRS